MGASCGTIFDIKKYAIHDGPGIRTTVFFKGCPLNCWWCHNPESQKMEPETVTIQEPTDNREQPSAGRKERIGRIISAGDLMDEIKKDVIFYDQSGGGVTFSGGEPMMQADFLLAILQECKAEGLTTVMDTSGYAPAEEFERIYDLVDLFLYDLKLMDDEAHIKYTGVSNELILENLTLLAERGEKVVLRIAMIPGITDSDENIEAIIDYIAPMKGIHEISLLPYNKFGEDKLKRFGMPNKLGSLKTQTRDEMKSILEKFTAHGYTVKTGG